MDLHRYPKDRLAREIALVLVIKLAFLTGLWLAFFRPPAHQPGTDIARVLLAEPGTDKVGGVALRAGRCIHGIEDNTHDCGRGR